MFTNGEVAAPFFAENPDSCPFVKFVVRISEDFEKRFRESRGIMDGLEIPPMITLCCLLSRILYFTRITSVSHFWKKRRCVKMTTKMSNLIPRGLLDSLMIQLYDFLE